MMDKIQISNFKASDGVLFPFKDYGRKMNTTDMESPADWGFPPTGTSLPTNKDINKLMEKVDIQSSAMLRLGERMNELISINKNMLGAIEALAELLRPKNAEEDVIELRSISLDQAKGEIFSLLKENPGFDFYDVSKHLKLDIEDVISACKELIEEGAIGEM